MVYPKCGLKKFPDVKPVTRPSVELRAIQDPNWLAGFIDGDGSFHIVSISKSSQIGYYCQLHFTVSQHSRDLPLLSSFITFLGCGRLCKSSTRTAAVEFVVTKLRDLEVKIIPFFKKYPLHGKKRLDFEDFCKIAALMKDKAHLTEIGLDQIRKIKSRKSRDSG